MSDSTDSWEGDDEKTPPRGVRSTSVILAVTFLVWSLFYLFFSYFVGAAATFASSEDDSWFDLFVRANFLSAGLALVAIAVAVVTPRPFRPTTIVIVVALAIQVIALIGAYAS